MVFMNIGSCAMGFYYHSIDCNKLMIDTIEKRKYTPPLLQDVLNISSFPHDSSGNLALTTRFPITTFGNGGTKKHPVKVGGCAL